MSDNYLNTLDKKWNAKIINKKPQINNVIQRNTINKYKKIKRYVSP